MEGNIGEKGYEPSTVTIFIRNKGIVLQEISLVLIHKKTNKIMAFGNEAEQAMESVGDDVIAVNPLRRGIIAWYTVSVKMFQFFIQKALGCTDSYVKRTFFTYLRKPRIALCISELEPVTEVEAKAFEDCFIQAGAGTIALAQIPFEQVAEHLSERYPLVVGITWSGSDSAALRPFRDS